MHKTLLAILSITTIAFCQDTLKCVPDCRTGFVCMNGICVSKCNPPCPQGTNCDSSGNCISNSVGSNPYDEHWGMLIPGFISGIVGTVVGIVGIANGAEGYSSKTTKIAQKDLLTASGLMIGVSIPLSVFGVILQARHERWNRQHLK
jgi:hypothetical protein